MACMGEQEGKPQIQFDAQNLIKMLLIIYHYIKRIKIRHSFFSPGILSFSLQIAENNNHFIFAY